jgi:hypothetical protein
VTARRTAGRKTSRSRDALFAASGLFVGALAWFVGQQMSQLLVWPACTGNARSAILVLNAALAAICLAGGWPSLQAWRRPLSPAPVSERQRFLGAVGTMAALLFALTLLAQTAAGLILTGCER